MNHTSEKSGGLGSLPLIASAHEAGADLVWDRFDRQQPQCGFGSLGSCCRICSMGPCRIDPFDKGAQRGVCGADIDTISARTFARMVAGGTAAHSDHGRDVTQIFLAAARGESPDYAIKDVMKLTKLALDYGIQVEGRKVNDIAVELGEKIALEFGQQEGELRFINRAPLKRQEIWRGLGVVPRGIDREVVETMHRTTMGVDQDYRSLLLQATRTSLADGWGGSMITTELQDILFGTPYPTVSRVNLGVLREDQVNIVVHGHEPLLSEMIVVASRDKQMLEYAKGKGASGINIAGICCTANEILMRHGIPIAGNMLQQELAVTTGVVEAMIVDVQCVMQSLSDVARCFHTKVITASPKANIPGTVHIEFDEHRALDSAKEIVKTAIDNFPCRSGKTHIPAESMDMVAGFSHETISYMLGGLFRASYRPLNDNIINGRIRGVAGVVGCNNPKVPLDENHLTMVKELIANDVLVLQTGCSAIACAKAGLLVPEAASKYAGKGLAEVCETVGIPPVLHMGACVDNSRLLVAATAMVKEGGLGDDISDLPVAGAAPEWMSEKAIAIGQYFVASGVFTVFGVTWPTLASEGTTDYLFKEMGNIFDGGTWAFEPDPNKAAQLMIDHIDSKRKSLGIDKARERILYDMEMRRELEGG
ncbi:MAG: carbon-monoxide dehydrogenase catalytic subunit [Armatimonadetes bacterium CG2_30_59_28]|nr:anaerobic carbon-monoxide dehydrogenase catalytic subunit [Armatimonadota bacterium]OIO96429.1 MAG: carbon-monoxide dehydrogenase catalytic subunit [Armatimonadetes bacterium CG2_30_59_28]PIU66246.1 MAG: carbon-monoxide dehydrogenase catalytic subunit [Armatimonadetes bacterium CG07_land_8_20_14_0_80_59_28]PIX45076.1 MAG: carbon-monoxide dehydrogenase catalytic subunit [Armatimonadetes bacterium CG_4_8_14_3_um_filter_58_9]PIY43806.1 MAG: carbon-monoxide dehydrogenase catalytic subunit [Armat